MARRTKCISNLKQLGLAFMMYADDYDGWFPRASDSDSYYWHNVVSPYAGGLGENIQYKNKRTAFKCPSTLGMAPSGWSYNTDYTMNSNIAFGFVTPVDHRVSQISNPSSLNILTDGLGGTYDYNSWNSTSGGNFRIQNRHNNGANFLFCDGRVKWIGYDNWKDIDMTP